MGLHVCKLTKLPRSLVVSLSQILNLSVSYEWAIEFAPCRCKTFTSSSRHKLNHGLAFISCFNTHLNKLAADVTVVPGSFEEEQMLDIRDELYVIERDTGVLGWGREVEQASASPVEYAKMANQYGSSASPPWKFRPDFGESVYQRSTDTIIHRNGQSQRRPSHVSADSLSYAIWEGFPYTGPPPTSGSGFTLRPGAGFQPPRGNFQATYVRKGLGLGVHWLLYRLVYLYTWSSTHWNESSLIS